MLSSRGGHEEVVYVFGAVTKDAAIMGAFFASFNIGAQCFQKWFKSEEGSLAAEIQEAQKEREG